MVHVRLSSLLFASVALVLLGLGIQSSYAQTTGGTLRVAMTTNPPELDPHIQGTSDATRQIAVHVFEGLFTYDEEYNVIPQLVDDWSVSEDGLTYSFDLLRGVKFHNGNEMTALDVKASIERYKEVAEGGQVFDAVTSIETPDAQTLKIVLKEPIGTFLSVLANPRPLLAVLPADVAESRDVIRPPQLIGTGPYQISEWRGDEFVRLTRFEDYVPTSDEEASGLGGKRIAYLDEIQFMPVREAGTRIAGLETGDYDYVSALPITSLERVNNTPGLVPHILKPRWRIIAPFNHKSALSSQLEFRRAVQLALDMEEILHFVTSGNPEFYDAHAGYFPPQQSAWHTDAGAEYYNQTDVDKARQLLQAAGYDGGPITLLTNRDYDWMYRTALSVQDQLTRIGANVELKVLDWPGQTAQVREDTGWDIVITGSSLRLDPGAETIFGCRYYTKYCSDEMEALLLQGIQESAVEKRQDIYREIQELAYNDVPVVLVGDIFELEAAQSRVQGFASWYTPRFWNVWLD